MKPVAFITTSVGKDLIVSFALYRPDDPPHVDSLTLMRTPKYEPYLEEWERGATVSYDAIEEPREFVLLREVKYVAADNVLTVRSDKATYALDVRKVDPAELTKMRQVIKQMNFDSSIKLEGM